MQLARARSERRVRERDASAAARAELLDLPDELLLHIALQSDEVAAVGRLACTCRLLRALITDTDYFWQQMLVRHRVAHDEGARQHGTAPSSASPHAPAHADAVVARARALFIEGSTRLQWIAPNGSRDLLVVRTSDDDDAPRRSVAQLGRRVPGQLSKCAAITRHPLPSFGMHAVRIFMSMPAVVNDFAIGLVACTRDDQWAAHVPPSKAMRACVMMAIPRGAFLAPHTVAKPSRDGGPPVYAPRDWHEVAGRSRGVFSWLSEQAVFVVLDADRGRVYYALAAPERFAIAFDDAGQLAHRRDLRIYVALCVDKSWASIERVPLTDALRAELRAADDGYAAGRGERCSVM